MSHHGREGTELHELESDLQDARGTIAALRAEVERLRADGAETYDRLMASSDRQSVRADAAEDRAHAAESRLAAANALLKEVRKHRIQEKREGHVQLELEERIDAYLAGHEGPGRAFYDGSCLKCGSAPVGGDHLCHECRSAPSPARTAAEQKYPVRLGHTVRVQQEDGSVRVECDHVFKGDSRCGHCGIPFAELARRGLKP